MELSSERLHVAPLGANVGSPLSLNGVWQPLLDFANLCDNKQSYSRRFGRGEQ